MATSSLPATMLSAFLVTLVTVIVPSPSTVTAGRLAFTRGWRAAATFLTAVVALDIAVFCALALGFQPLLHRLGGAAYLVPAAAIGMIVVGMVMIVHPPQVAPRECDRDPPKNGLLRNELHGPFLAGLLVPAANPGFWLWWMTVGTSFIHAARQWGDLGLTALLASLLSGVLAWYLPLVLALRQGKTLFPPSALRRVLRLLGGALVLFGVNLLLKALKLIS
jgi:threonine/homoserine/homoserine lactone efflux protein